ncbi:hypothetical protein [Geodermatophilus sp. URMC 62]|uniref:hypothetical protein n=1 Tax=Geodermatophilus sp. URMC 62 TaxID=3423414 RepID=UPI00406C7316
MWLWNDWTDALQLWLAVTAVAVLLLALVAAADRCAPHRAAADDDDADLTAELQRRECATSHVRPAASLGSEVEDTRG